MVKAVRMQSARGVSVTHEPVAGVAVILDPAARPVPRPVGDPSVLGWIVHTTVRSCENEHTLYYRLQRVSFHSLVGLKLCL